MNVFFRAVLASFTLLASFSAGAHSGGLDAQGCHVNRKTGDYHCHRAPARAQDVSSTYQGGQHLVSPHGASRSQTGGTGSFANCAQARAAGAAPVRIGDPGYGPHLDRDGDGIGCEAHRQRR